MLWHGCFGRPYVVLMCTISLVNVDCVLCLYNLPTACCPVQPPLSRYLLEICHSQQYRPNNTLFTVIYKTLSWHPLWNNCVHFPPRILLTCSELKENMLLNFFPLEATITIATILLLSRKTSISAAPIFNIAKLIYDISYGYGCLDFPARNESKKCLMANFLLYFCEILLKGGCGANDIAPKVA